MKMCNDTLTSPYLKVDKTLNDLTYGIAKEYRFGIVPRSIQGIQLLGIPKVGENLIFFTDIMGEIHQYSNRLSLDIPIPRTYTQALLLCPIEPRRKERGIFDKFRVFLA